MHSEEFLKNVAFSRQRKLNQDEEIKNMFNNVDVDGSGMLELAEIHQLFQNSGIMLTKDQIRSLFFEKNCSTLSLEQFLKVSKDEKYRYRFRKIMRDIKQQIKLK